MDSSYIDLYIRNSNGNRYWKMTNAMISPYDISIWNRAISNIEIVNLFNNSDSFSNEEGLVANYKFNAGSGDILYDHSGNANHGTIYGATWVDNSINGCCYELLGDVDCNSELDISDIIILIEIILDEGTYSSDQIECSDLDYNEEVDISDLIILIEYILEN